MSEIPRPNPNEVEQNQGGEVVPMPMDSIRREELRLAATQRAHQENMSRPTPDRDPLMAMIREEVIAEKEAKIEEMKAERSQGTEVEDTRKAA